jgi:hypothetical protein
MEYSQFASDPHHHSTTSRKESAISSELDLDLSDMEHCILCFNNLVFFAIGKCGHKNVCNTCALRLRFIIKDI